MRLWRFMVVGSFGLFGLFGSFGFFLQPDKPHKPHKPPLYAASVPPHECHLLNLPEPAWEERVTVLDSAVHGPKTYMLVLTEDGCRCMLEGGAGVTAPANGAQVKIYGIRLGIPGFTRLQLIAMEIEIPA